MSVRVRLTSAVAALVGAIVLAAALIAPGRVESALIDDVLAAEVESQSVEVLGFDSQFLTIDGELFVDDEFVSVVGDGATEVIGEFVGGDVVVSDPFGVGLEEAELAVAAINALDDDDRDRLQALSGGDEVVVALDVGRFFRFDDQSVTSFGADPFELDQPLIGIGELFDLAFGQLDGKTPDRLIGGVEELDGIEFIVFADAASIDRTVERVRTSLWLVVPIAALLAGLATWLLAGRALRPVGAITAQTKLISSGTLGDRVPVPNSSDEIATLATTMNGMLERLERDDTRRRRFVSDASHELRTPVAVMRSEAEVALRVPDQTDVVDLASGMLEESTRLASIIDDLLALARHDEGVPAPTSEIDLDDIVLAEAARTRRVRVDVSAVSAGRVAGRADEFANAVSHLLDNAARHADTQVRVALTSASGRVSLTVDDDGPGIAPDDRRRVFERFVRLDAARARDSGGAGLGLAVVVSAVERSGGTIRIETSPIGGARFVVDLPAA